MFREDFKAVIVGGSVTGLTLANILEKTNVDFVLLEAYPKIAPQVGASIGIWPNGLRVLDQLGCYEAFANIDDFLNELTLRLKGKLVGGFKGIASQMKKRHGYEVVFHDRQRLLQVLYDNLRQKEKILVNKRVAKVDLTKSGVSVETKDGETFTGDIVVGADGIHSTVRKEMWRIGTELAPLYFPPNELKNVPITYRALFGIASPKKSLPPHIVNPVWNKGFSNLIFGGPGGRVYWFLFDKLDRAAHGDEAPRYSKQDELDLVEKHRHDPITEDVALGDLYDSSETTGMTPLHECMFEKWHFSRIITLGDAVHKMNPIAGQGGNCCIEDAAALSNSLLRSLEKCAGSLKDADIDAIFSETQASRCKRAQAAVDMSHAVQRVEALEAPLAGIMVQIMLPLLSRDMLLERDSGMAVGGVRVEKLDMPSRTHFVPYIDELPALPLSAGVFSAAVVGVTLLGLWFNEIFGLQWAGFDTVVCDSRTASAPTLPTVTIFGTILLTWTVEGLRRGNWQTLSGRLLIWPSVFITTSLVWGFSRVAPLYYLASLVSTNDPIYQRTSGRIVSAHAARVLLPAFLIGYVVPAAAMSFSLNGARTAQVMTNVWSFGTAMTIPLVHILAALWRTFDHPSASDSYELAELNNDDLPHLSFAYVTAALATATSHLYSFSSLAKSLFPSISMFGEPYSSPFQTPEIATSATCISLWGFYSVYEMRRLGYATTQQMLTAAIIMAGSLLSLGPCATYIGLCLWKERTIAGLCK